MKWVLIYDGTKCVDLLQVDDVANAHTKFTLESFDTLAAAVARATALGLTDVPPDVLQSVPDPVALAVDFRNRAIGFGQELLLQFASGLEQRGLTAEQRYQAAGALGPIESMLNAGDLAGVLAILPQLPVDGVILTKAIVAGFEQAIQTWLTANPTP